MSPTFGHIPPETLTQAERILRRADGIAIVTCRPIKTQSGDTRPFGDGSLHPYFKQVIAIDERRFLHAESGATAVIVQKPDFDIPELDAATWWGLAAQLGDVHTEEVVVVKDGKLLLESEADQWNSLWSQLHTRFEMK